MVSTMSGDALHGESSIAKAASCLAWLAVFGLLGALVTVLVSSVGARWCDNYTARQSHALMIEQAEQIKRGSQTCLVQPDPNFIHKVIADADCAAHIHELYLGGDVSHKQLGRLRELPNLKCVVLLFATGSDVLLERLHGMPTIEQLNLERTWVSGRGIAHIQSFPKLKSLSLQVDADNLGALDGIKNNTSIENLVISRAGYDNRLLPLLQSLPRLRSVTIEDAQRDAESSEGALRQALPNCQCSVRLGP